MENLNTFASRINKSIASVDKTGGQASKVITLALYDAITQGADMAALAELITPSKDLATSTAKSYRTRAKAVCMALHRGTIGASALMDGKVPASLQAVYTALPKEGGKGGRPVGTTGGAANEVSETVQPLADVVRGLEKVYGLGALLHEIAGRTKDKTSKAALEALALKASN